MSAPELIERFHSSAFGEEMIPAARGDWVRYSDHEARLTEAVEALREVSDILAACTFPTIYQRGQYVDRREAVARARAALAKLEDTP